MNLNFLHIIRRSVTFYRYSIFYQVIIIALLAGVITGSLMVGKSVRNSLINNSSQRLGNTGIMLTSGVRYFNPSLTSRLGQSINAECVSILEINGYCRNFASGRTAVDVNIFGIGADFFPFQGIDTIQIRKGEIAINEKLASNLEIKEGDDIIIHFRKITEIPSNAPFAPDKDNEVSVVLTVGSILLPEMAGNFSLGISQIVPMNIFINLSDLEGNFGNELMVNRLLFKKRSDITPAIVSSHLKETLIPEDIGMNFRFIKKTFEYEIVSDRIFIDNEIVDNIVQVIPSAEPVITYLANSINAGYKTTPYSFVSALPVSLYPQVPSDKNIIINRWLADDINARVGDTVTMSWYVNDLMNNLKEQQSSFQISGIVGMEGIWSDSLLMPDFPGIAGSESCGGWDAGIPVSLDKIRKKDEEYWNRFKGTPKAFINYKTGEELWGNNFGPATAIRFPSDLDEDGIKTKLRGNLDPDKSGFLIKDLKNEAIEAASTGVDFSSLFLSLGIFIIISSIYLLSLVVSVFFDTRKTQVYTLRAIGFTNKRINRILYYETVMISFAGTITGVLAGILFNYVIINALNSVWIGAVQTNTLSASIDLSSIFFGFTLSNILILIFLKIKVTRYLQRLSRKESGIYKGQSATINLWFLITSLSIALILIILSFLSAQRSVVLAFSGGSIMLISFILAARQIVLGGVRKGDKIFGKSRSLTRSYFAFYPSHITAPVLFIAAGLFVLITTGANRKDFSRGVLSASGGTGGFLLWCDLAVPIIDDLNTPEGIYDNNIDKEELNGMSFVQIKKFAGDDASCLNLNHVKAPPILGLDPSMFINDGSFSFANSTEGIEGLNPWELLRRPPEGNTIYGIADQTVLQWGLKLKAGDTLIVRAENGQPLNIILAAGLNSSVFQGNVIIGEDCFSKFMPSVAGSSILLVKGNDEFAGYYTDLLSGRLEKYGISIDATSDRLAEFYQVTNTYLSVFNVLGAFGMVIGVIGLGFILMRNYNMRKREFALMLASGFPLKIIRRSVFDEQVFILFTGVISGTVPALLATLPSLGTVADFPWSYMVIMIFSILLSGLAALFLSVRIVRGSSLISSLRRE